MDVFLSSACRLFPASVSCDVLNRKYRNSCAYDYIEGCYSPGGLTNAGTMFLITAVCLCVITNLNYNIHVLNLYIYIFNMVK